MSPRTKFIFIVALALGWNAAGCGSSVQWEPPPGTPQAAPAAPGAAAADELGAEAEEQEQEE
jgi:hypothetical protein